MAKPKHQQVATRKKHNLLAHNNLHAVKTANSVDFSPTLQKICNWYIYIYISSCALIFSVRKVNEFKNKKQMRLNHELTTNHHANYINYKKNELSMHIFLRFFCLLNFIYRLACKIVWVNAFDLNCSAIHLNSWNFNLFDCLKHLNWILWKKMKLCWEHLGTARERKRERE